MYKALLFFLLVFTGTCLAGPLDTWYPRLPSPPSEMLNSVAYGNGIYVAVGGSGGNIAMVSTNGTDWKAIPPPSPWPLPLQSVAFGQGLFVAVGRLGVICTSTDGISWQIRNSPLLIDFSRVRYCGDRFLLTGYTGYMVVSINGVDWVEKNPGIIATFYDMTYGNGTYVAVGSGGTIATSTNATNWTAHVSGTTTAWRAVTFANGRFVAVGYNGIIGASTNAQDWVLLPSGTTDTLYGVAFNNGIFVAVSSSNLIITSADATNWVKRLEILPFSSASGFLDVISAPCGFVATGVGYASPSGGELAFSQDGIRWCQLYGRIDGVTYGANRFVTVGEAGNCRVSMDGTNWTISSAAPNHLHAIAFGDDKFVAVGEAGVATVSTDAVSWASQTVDTNQLLGVAYGGQTFVAVGYHGRLLTSTNGADWTIQDSGTGLTLYAVCWGPLGFVAVGLMDILTSTDAVHWVRRYPAALRGKQCISVACHDHTYVVGSSGLTFLASTDLTNWAIVREEAGYDAATAISWGNGVFVAGTGSGKSYKSADGQTWMPGVLRSNAPVFSIAYGNGSFVAVGERGAILQSGPIFSLSGRSPAPGAPFELRLQGEQGRTYRVQTSPDLVNWDDLVTVSNASEVVTFSDNQTSAVSKRFYRALLP